MKSCVFLVALVLSMMNTIVSGVGITMLGSILTVISNKANGPLELVAFNLNICSLFLVIWTSVESAEKYSLFELV